MSQLFATWWTAVSSYFVTAASVFSGQLTTLPLLALAGIVCLVAGIALLFAWQVKRATGLLWLAAAALLSPIATSFANSILGWVGMPGAVLAGAILLVVGIAIMGNHAERRLPVWLIGIFLIDLSFFCALSVGAFIALT